MKPMSHHRLVGLLTCVLALASSSALLPAANPPTPEQPVGWRGDGTGRYLDAQPPLHWSVVAKPVLGLTSQAAAPQDDKPAGEAMPDGVIRQWLVLGPLDISAATTKEAMEKGPLADEAQFAPRENDKVGELTWKLAKVPTAAVNLNDILGRKSRSMAYVCSNVYTDSPVTVLMQVNTCGTMRAWLNGKPIAKAEGPAGTKIVLPLTKGWNRLLFKVATEPAPANPAGVWPSWYVSPVLYGMPPCEYEKKGIRWATTMPGAGCGAPIVVGNRVFALAESDLLVCLDKDSGKVLWVRSNNLYDATTAADRKADPAFAEIEPLSARLAEIDKLSASDTPPDVKVLAERAKAQKDLNDRLKKIDKARYNRTPGDIGFAGLTPCSDGKNVYVWVANGVSACYDLDGTRKWIRLDAKYDNFEHGWSTSPLLIDGKLITYMRDVVAIDAATGATAWTTPHTPLADIYPGGRFHGSMVAAKIGDTKVIVLPSSHILRAGDGKVLFNEPGLNHTQQIPSPVIDGGVFYRLDTQTLEWPPPDKGGSLHAMKLPDAAGEGMKMADTKVMWARHGAFPRYYNDWYTASPLVHDGLAYALNCQGVLTVFDVKEAKVVYQQLLDLNQFESHGEGVARGVGASPTLAGGYIYLTGNFGTMVVIKPGRTFQPVARNHIERWVDNPVEGWLSHMQRTVSCPVFEGKRMYYRAETTLYCIEE